MNISTTYLGMKLDNPFVPAASPLTSDLGTVRKLEEAGAPMIVMHSIFQEQLDREQVALHQGLEQADNSNAEALSYLPRPEQFRIGPEEYIEQLARIKAAVRIPVVASLNGRTRGGWVKFAQQMEVAGAAALELNIYDPVLCVDREAASIEKEAEEVVREVCKTVSIPVAVKISPFYTNTVHFALRLVAAGAKGLVLFNRFYQPDIDVENLEALPTLKLSTSDTLRLRLRYTAALFGKTKADIAVTGGVHTAIDGLKAVMAGASAVQLASALLTHGPAHLKALRQGLAQWLEAHEYDSLAQAKGSMSLEKTPNPSAFERGNYMKILQTWSAG
jgi:dihydroorotate dehydrogenase (fumarate)